MLVHQIAYRMTNDSSNYSRAHDTEGGSIQSREATGSGGGPRLRFTTGLVGAVVLTAVAVVAFASLPTPAAQPGIPDATESPVATIVSGASSPTPVPTDAAPPTEALALDEPTPPEATTPTGTELERSDFFWNAVSGGDWHNIYASLDEIVSDSDLIVVGSITDLRFGDTVRGFEVTRASVVLSEVLKGEPQTRNGSTITLQLPPVLPSEQNAILGSLPEHPHLLFLYYAPSEAERDGVADTAPQEELYDYVMVNGVQGVLRNINEEARPLPGADLTPFPSDLDGRPFASVLADVRAMSPATTETQ